MAEETGFRTIVKNTRYAAGFKSINLSDSSRSFNPGKDMEGNPIAMKTRPLQTSIWYPVEKKAVKDKEPMRYKEYIHLLALEKHFGALDQKRKKKALDRFFKMLKTPQEKRKDQQGPTSAYRDAEPAKGRFPLLVYGASINSFSFENTLLMEYLAGHGYIVVSSPCMGESSRWMRPDLAGVEAQVKDMEFLMKYMGHFPNVDRSKTALLGFSWGGLSNVLVAMRNSGVDVIVCLDGTICYPLGYNIIKKAGDYKPENIKIPALFLRSRDIPEELFKKQGAEKPDQSFEFYDKLKHNPSYVFRFHHLVHHNFSSAFIRFRKRKPQFGELSQAEIENSYRLMCKYTRIFLDAYLKGDAEAQKTIKQLPGEIDKPYVQRENFNHIPVESK